MSFGSQSIRSERMPGASTSPTVPSEQRIGHFLGSAADASSQHSRIGDGLGVSNILAGARPPMSLKCFFDIERGDRNLALSNIIPRICIHSRSHCNIFDSCFARILDLDQGGSERQQPPWISSIQPAPNIAKAQDSSSSQMCSTAVSARGVRNAVE